MVKTKKSFRYAKICPKCQTSITKKKGKNINYSFCLYL